MEDNYNEILNNPLLKHHLEDGDKMIWYKDPNIVATWHSNGKIDLPCFDTTNVTISAANFRILKGHWRKDGEHGVGTEANHWLYNDIPISEFLELYPDFWKAIPSVANTVTKSNGKSSKSVKTTNSNNSSIISRQSNMKRSYKYESERLLFNSSFSDKYSQDLRTQATPSWVAEDMVDLLPDEVWRTDSKFLDIYCKSGIFLEVIMDRLLKKVDYSTIGLTDKYEIIEYIRKNQVYAICWTIERVELARTVINGKVIKEYNVALLEKNDRYIKEEPLGFDKFVKETFSNMKFDVVVGNPPYNNDLYLDFVQLGHKLASKYDCWITPAKWQAKGGEKNEAFRSGGYVTVKRGGTTVKEYWDAIVPHMSKIVYYPVATEIFSIAEIDGITISLLDREEHTHVEIENVSKTVSSFNNKHNRSINECLNNTLFGMASKYTLNEKKFSDKLIFGRSTFGMESYDSMIEMVETKGKYKILTATVSNPKILQGYCDAVSKGADIADKYKLVVCHMMGYNLFYDDNGQSIGANRYTIYNTDELVAGNNMVLFASSNIKEVESIKSYIETKFIRFITLCSLISTKVNNVELWRFVPDPGPFDHIFTDEELYKKYNLTEEEINIIESVIKERK